MKQSVFGSANDEIWRSYVYNCGPLHRSFALRPLIFHGPSSKFTHPREISSPCGNSGVLLCCMIIGTRSYARRTRIPTCVPEAAFQECITEVCTFCTTQAHPSMSIKWSASRISPALPRTGWCEITARAYNNWDNTGLHHHRGSAYASKTQSDRQYILR